MTKIRFDSKVSASAADALSPLAGALYSRLGTRRVCVMELASVERNQLAEEESKDSYVKVRVTFCEVANEEQEETLRQAMRALRLHRTASGTLDEEGEVALSEATLKQVADLLHAHEAARLRAGAQHWLDYMRGMREVANPSVMELRHELDIIMAGLQHLLHGQGGGALPMAGEGGTE